MCLLLAACQKLRTNRNLKPFLQSVVSHVAHLHNGRVAVAAFDSNCFEVPVFAYIRVPVFAHIRLLKCRNRPDIRRHVSPWKSSSREHDKRSGEPKHLVLTNWKINSWSDVASACEHESGHLKQAYGRSCLEHQPFRRRQPDCT